MSPIVRNADGEAAQASRSPLPRREVPDDIARSFSPSGAAQARLKRRQNEGPPFPAGLFAIVSSLASLQEERLHN
jgi:hypothetical protein